MSLDSKKESIFSIVKCGPLRTFNLKNTSEKSGFVKKRFFSISMQNQQKIFYTFTR